MKSVSLKCCTSSHYAWQCYGDQRHVLCIIYGDFVFHQAEKAFMQFTIKISAALLQFSVSFSLKVFELPCAHQYDVQFLFTCISLLPFVLPMTKECRYSVPIVILGIGLDPKCSFPNKYREESKMCCRSPSIWGAICGSVPLDSYSCTLLQKVWPGEMSGHHSTVRGRQLPFYWGNTPIYSGSESI